VDVDVFHAEDRAPPGPGGDGPKLLFLGRLEPRTGLPTLLAAMPRVASKFPGVELTVAGDGPWLAAYRRQASRLGVPVRFLGQVFSERAALYRKADVYLNPTSRASFGMTLLEAMGCGTPMIVSDIPAFREVADEHAVVVPAGDADRWADAVIALLENQAQRRTMSAAGRERSLAFAWPKITDRLLAVYERVAGGRPAGSLEPGAAAQ
jgi:phosphatidylinositol alpha-mannosyltransferase